MAPLLNDKVFLEGIFSLDEIAEKNEGQYVIPISEAEPRYDLRELLKYANRQNISTKELTDRDLEMFLIKK